MYSNDLRSNHYSMLKRIPQHIGSPSTVEAILERVTYLPVHHLAVRTERATCNANIGVQEDSLKTDGDTKAQQTISMMAM